VMAVFAFVVVAVVVVAVVVHLQAEPSWEAVVVVVVAVVVSVHLCRSLEGIQWASYRSGWAFLQLRAVRFYRCCCWVFGV